MSKNYRTKSRISGQWSWRTIEMMESPAFRVLSHSAHCALALPEPRRAAPRAAKPSGGLALTPSWNSESVALWRLLDGRASIRLRRSSVWQPAPCNGSQELCDARWSRWSLLPCRQVADHAQSLRAKQNPAEWPRRGLDLFPDPRGTRY